MNVRLPALLPLALALVVATSLLPPAQAVPGGPIVITALSDAPATFVGPSDHSCVLTEKRSGEERDIRVECVPFLPVPCRSVTVNVAASGVGAVTGISACTTLVASCTVTPPLTTGCSATTQGFGLHPWTCQGIVNGAIVMVTVTCAHTH